MSAILTHRVESPGRSWLNQGWATDRFEQEPQGIERCGLRASACVR